MKNICDVIERFGGGTKVAALLGVSAQAITNMKSRGSFPPRHWPALISEAKRVGCDEEITLDFLVGMGRDESPVAASPAPESPGAAP